MVVVLKLGNPEPWLEAILPLTRWMMGSIGWVVWSSVCLLGLIQVLVHSRELLQNSVQVVSPHNWLCLVLSWLGLKLIHETAHGVSCLSRGGRVREWGLNTVLFVPLPFVDVTSAWRFPSKWSRMQVAAAGMSAELFVAAVAVQVWCRAADLRECDAVRRSPVDPLQRQSADAV
jgi:putative peptide zinc metalloprotease protein